MNSDSLPLPATRRLAKTQTEPVKFLSALFSTKLPKHYLLVWVKNKPQGGTSFWFTDLEKGAQFATEQSRTFDVYFGIALAGKKYGSSQRVKADEAVAIPGFWIEIDYQSTVEAHKKTSLPANEKEALTFLDSLPFKPTLIVNSGNGLHVYWLLDALWIFADSGDRDRAKEALEKWHRIAESRAATYGWTIDSTFDLARVYRVAGTKNFKGEKPKPVRVVRHDATAHYQLDTLLQYVSAQKVSAHRTQQAKEIKDATASMGALKLDPNADISMVKFEMLCEVEPKVRLSWERKRKDFRDQSGSSYDLSLANSAARAGWSDQEIANLMIASRRKHGDELKLRQDYYAGTIAKAHQESARNEGQQAVEKLAAEGSEQSSRVEILKRLSTLLTVRVTSFQCQLTQPRSYVMRLGGYVIHRGKSA